MARNYSDVTLKRLFLMSGHYCAFPGCTSPIFEIKNGVPEILGEIAHIEGSSNNGPRANPSLSASARDSYSNLIVLCRNHHGLVDRLDSEYSVSTLREWKREVEKATSDKLSVGATKVSFAELKIVCNAFVDGDTVLPSTPMLAVPPQAKMDANELTDAIRPTMNIGLSQAPQVADFLRRQAQLSARFPERLRAGFVREYHRLLESGVSGDELFLSLVDFGTNSVASPQVDNSRHFVIRAAAVAVLCHLFEVCDLFEAPAA